MTQAEETVTIEACKLSDAAVEIWRLQRWAFQSGYEKERVIARQAARGLSSFLSDLEIEVCDLTGQAYNEGLSVEVVDFEGDRDAHGQSARIVEMLAPIVFWRGRVIKAGQVVVGGTLTANQEMV